jgi:hypothetical protein
MTWPFACRNHVMAHDRAAVLAGVTRDGIYIQPGHDPGSRLLLASGVMAGTERWGQLAPRADGQPDC